MPEGGLRRWRVAGVVATAVIVAAVPLSLVKQKSRGALERVDVGSTFVGREACSPCHEKEVAAWAGSDHDLAMAEATEETVLGDFDDASFDDGIVSARFFRRDQAFIVSTAGPDGEESDFEIVYTFGVEPLQQYLVPFQGGRLQSLTIAWDTVGEQWFNLYPGQRIPQDDWLHWTQGGQNWNGMCAECHSTNLKKGFDPQTGTFETSWSEIDVSCEACHGPGLEHVAWAEVPPMARLERENFGLVIRTRNISAREQVELCAPCHARRSELGDYDHTSGALLHSLVPALLEEGLYHADGQILEEVYVYGSFVQSKMYVNDVRCDDCHDVHTLKLKADGNELCAQCHQAQIYDSADHHFHKKVHLGEPSDGALCVKCHMPEQPYMVIDWRADHSLRVPRPDLTAELGVPNACGQAACHADRPLSWIVDSHERWYGQAKKPHYGTVLAAGRNGDPKALPKLVRLAGDPLYSPVVRATALALLRPYSGEESTGAFERALVDDEALVRYTAVMNAYATSTEHLVEMLVPLLFDPVKGVRIQAASRLAGAPPELLEPYQREALASGINEFEKDMRYSLDFAFAGHNLGNLYTNLGRPNDAERAYRAAIAVDDLFTPAKVNLATLLNAAGRNDEAESLLRQVLEAEPEAHEVAYSLGLLLAELQRFDEASVFLARASGGVPDRARVHYNHGLVLQVLERFTEAEAALVRALALSPEAPDILHALADHHLRRRQLGHAREYAVRLVDAHPDHQAGRQLLAFIDANIAQSLAQ